MLYFSHFVLDLQVDVGDLLRFKACVLYTESERADRPLIHVEVVAYVTQPELKCSEVGRCPKIGQMWTAPSKVLSTMWDRVDLLIEWKGPSPRNCELYLHALL